MLSIAEKVLERIPFNMDVWAVDLLPLLQTLYFETAVPYLCAKGRPGPKREASGQDATSYWQFETSLSSDLCIDGQNGSSECTIIFALFVQKFMSAEVFLDNREKLEAAMCFAMQEGNHLNEK